MRTLLVLTVSFLGLACSDHEGGAPAAPTGLAAAKLGSGIHLTWMDNSMDEDEFVVMRKTAGGSYGEVATVPFNTTQYHDEPVTPGTAYTYQIMAMKGSSHAFSNEVTFTFTP